MALYDDRKKKPQDDAAAGAALRTGLVNAGQVVQGTGLAALDNLSRPVRNVQAELNNVGRGFVGLPAAQPTDTPFQDLGAALRPSTNAPIPLPAAQAATPSAPAAPARNPAGPGPAAGAPAPAGRVAAPPAANFSNAQGASQGAFQVNLGAGNVGGGGTVKESVASALSNGVPTYDNASIARLNARNGVTAAPAGAAPLPLPAAYAAAPVATPNLAVNVPRPVVADPYNTREANADLKKIADTIDARLFENSFAADRGSRSAREAQAQMLGTLAALGGKRLDVAANVAGGDRDAAAKYDLTGLEQSGANQRALLQDQGETGRTGMTNASEERRAYLQSLAEMGRNASTVTDENGNLVRVGAMGDAAPVLDASGKPVRPLQGKTDRPDANTIVTSYTAQKKALDDAASITGKPADYSALDSSPLGQAYQQVLGGNAGTVPGEQTATNPKTRERMRFNSKTQQWEPIK